MEFMFNKDRSDKDNILERLEIRLKTLWDFGDTGDDGEGRRGPNGGPVLFRGRNKIIMMIINLYGLEI